MSQPASTIIEDSIIGLPPPDGWRLVKLRDVIREAQGGFASGERDASGVIQLRMNNVTTSGQFDWSSFIRVPASPGTVQIYQLDNGDVLFNNTNSIELVGKSALFEGHNEPVVFSNHFTRLRTDENFLEPRFLALWLQHQWQRHVFTDICNRWIGQSAVQRDKLLALEIPLPPLTEQKRIAAILTEQVSAVERSRAAAEAQLNAAKDLPAAYLRAVFDSPESKEWQRRQLEEVCGISTGTTPDTNRADYYKGEIPFIKTSELLDNRISESEIYVSKQAADDYRLKPYPVGTVLLAMYGQGKTRGRVGLLDISATTTQNAAALVPDASLDSEFLWLWLRSQYKFLRGIGYQGDLSHLSLGFVKQLEIPVPLLSIQRSIAAALIKELESSEQLRQKTQEQFDVIEHLSVALLRQAFTGKL